MMGPNIHFWGFDLLSMRIRHSDHPDGDPGIERRILSTHWSWSDAPCSSIVYVHRHCPWAKISATLGVSHFPHKTLQEKGTPLALPLQHGITGTIVQLSIVTSGLYVGHWKIHFRYFVEENGHKLWKLGNFDAPQLWNQEADPRWETHWSLDYIVEWPVSVCSVLSVEKDLSFLETSLNFWS